MTAVSFKNAVITGLAAAVPSQKLVNLESDFGFPDAFVAAALAKTGVSERRQAPSGLCASDLGFFAAERLIDEMGIDRADIAGLIFVSQSPDYVMPMTSAILQSRLGLSTSTASFDMNIGCSGYVYGLMVAFSLVESGFPKVLVINAENATRRYSPRDRATSLLFGDAGAATLIERQENSGRSFFELSTDGDRAEAIIIPAGGSRNPSTSETRIERLREDGSYRSDEQGSMNGAEVFSTVISEVPQQILSIMSSAGVAIDHVDQFFFHQASNLVNERLRKKLGIPEQKFSYSLGEFGNTSGVSIPLTMVTRTREVLQEQSNTVVLAGYGVGMSWASSVLSLPKLHVPLLIEI